MKINHLIYLILVSFTNSFKSEFPKKLNSKNILVMSFLITCAGSKRIPLDVNISHLEDLSFNVEMLQARQEMIGLYHIPLDWDRTLPAWQLYSGTRSKIYPQIIEANWNNPNTDIKILSALFGWINHYDQIPYYDLKMTTIINNLQVWRIWRRISDLAQIINFHDIDLLSGDYRKAVCGRNHPIASIPQNVEFTDYGVQKGRWLNDQLNAL